MLELIIILVVLALIGPLLFGLLTLVGMNAWIFQQMLAMFGLRSESLDGVCDWFDRRSPV